MLYTLVVQLTDGPITEAFLKQNPIVVRTIQIRSDQTLDQLHRAIFRAFERDDPHMYEFRFGDKFKMAPERRYVMAEALEHLDKDERPSGITSKTTMASLGLKPGDVFHYWFDFGDDWWHWIEVKAIDRTMPEGRFPKIVSRTGESPPQYLPEGEEVAE